MSVLLVILALMKALASTPMRMKKGFFKFHQITRSDLVQLRNKYWQMWSK